MGLLRWFGFSKSEESTLEKLYSKELKQLETVVTNARAKQEIVSKKYSTTPEIEIRKTLSHLITDNITENNLFYLEEQLKKQLQTNELSDHIILKIRNEFNQDSAWSKLKKILNEEKTIINNTLDKNSLERLKELIQKENYIIDLLEKITKSEFSELHAHCSNTIPLNYTFKLLVDIMKNKNTSRCLLGKIKECKSEMYIEDYKEWLAIYKELSKGRDGIKIRERFEKMLEVKEEHGDFVGFLKKDAALKPMWWAIEGSKLPKPLRKQYGSEAAIYALGEDLANQGIRYFELRYPPGVDMISSIASAQKTLDANGVGVKIKLIPFSVGKNIDEFVTAIQEMQISPHFKDFVVGLDYSGPDTRLNYDFTPDLRKLEQFHLPLTTHIGEFLEFDMKDYKKKKPKMRFEIINAVLEHIEQFVDFKYTKRLGHLSIMGRDLPEFFKKYFTEAELRELPPEYSIEKLEEKRKRIAEKIREQGIYVESNPQSNIRINDLHNMELHPAKIMINDYNINITVSTDDRIQFATHIQQELFNLSYALRLKQEELDKIIKNAHDARFG